MTCISNFVHQWRNQSAAITISDPPILVFGPSPFSPRAKIVGNMSDMKRLVNNMGAGVTNTTTS